MLYIVYFAAYVVAWGSQGHAIVGSVAQAFLDSNAQTQISSILSSSAGQLADIASWADTVKYESSYAYTKVLHYIDIQDNPPLQCGFDERRDCEKGDCIIGAIAAFTQQAKCGHSKSSQAEAVKFLVHFFGDITQPLHVSNRDVGGNTDKVLYAGKSTNLHAVWDTPMVEDRIRENKNQATYVKYLITKIKTGSYCTVKTAWISQYGVDDISQYNNSKVAIDYAIDSDKYSCHGVWDEYDANTNQDLAGAYYKQASPIIDIQLAKGGYRLADYLNKLFAHCPDVSSGSARISARV